MAYRELVKNFEKIRAYMRDFYVYGFKQRNDFTKKSLRSYDDEKRRIESYLGSYMKFTNTADGKRVFISIDSREVNHNPLYKAWKAKSFTDGDITLHFILMDILKEKECLTVNEITRIIDEEYLSHFENNITFDESTVRKKLKEYELTGIVEKEKNGRATFYKLKECVSLIGYEDALDYFSEVAPLGVVGSFLLDKTKKHREKFSFKHHYITSTVDSEVLHNLLTAIREKRSITVKNSSTRGMITTEQKLVPLKIFISVQSGRSYLLAYSEHYVKIASFRLDNLSDITLCDECKRFDELRAILDNMQKNMWGASTGDGKGSVYHTEFTVYVPKGEEYIIRRLEREKRCGRIEKVDSTHYRFSAYLADEYEIVPWIRTFICRITDVSFTDKKLERQFKEDIDKMYEMYIGGEA